MARCSPPAPPAGALAGVALLGLAGLLFQVALTRLASAALDYHLAFLAVSAGVLGTGAGATWVACGALGGGRWPRLGPLAVGTAWGIAGAGAAFAWLPLGRLGPGGLLAAILLAYPVLAAPYACSGAAVALAVRAWASRAGRVYAADLLGAGAGCLLAVPLMDAFGPPLAVGAAALVAGAASRLFGPAQPRWLLLGGAAASLAVLSGLAQPGDPNVLPGKPLAVFLDQRRYPGARRELTWWDATSRVDVFVAPGAPLLWGLGGAAGGSDAPGPGALPELRGVTIDADALSAVVRREAGEPLAVAGRLPASVAYSLAPRRDVLVIGPGGGADVAAALAYGATRVDAVEVNRGMARLMAGPLAGFSGALFAEPRVHLVVDEGRGFLGRSGRRYDAIVLTAVDSWAALAAGSYSLAESYLYTRQAMAAYLDHLSDGGVLAISRWYTAPPRELQRLAAMAGDALEARGFPAARGRLLLRAGDFGTLLVRRGPFPPEEEAAARAFAAAGGFALEQPSPPAEGAQRSGAGGLPSGGAAAATDDRPFFFDFVSWGAVLRGAVPLGALPRGHAVLLVALVQGACLGLAGLVVPWRRLPRSLPPGRRLALGAYAGGAGLGFMLAELSLVQRLTLLLGHPALSLAVTLAGLLLGAGAGSALWAVWAEQGAPPGRGAPSGGASVVLLAAALLALHAGVLPGLWQQALGWPLGGRIAVAAVVLLLTGAALGPALPAGAARLGRGDPAVLPWLWGVNGAASAAGAALAVLLAMEWGLGAVLLLAGALYAGMAVLLAGAPQGGGPAATAAERVRIR